MKTPPSFLTFNKSQRRGIVWTVVIFAVLHFGIRFYPKPYPENETTFRLDSLTQQKVDSFAVVKSLSNKDTIYPFNPNYISDFKAYQLDISMEVVRRIRAFRASGNYINSVKVFKQVTQLPNNEVDRISPYLKIPKPRLPAIQPKKVARIKNEFNGATAADLQEVHGIGEAYANRIIDLRNKLGGFLDKNQLDDVWGLPPEVKQRVWLHFKLDALPLIKKKNINEMTIAQLSSLYYVSPSLASRIVAVRTQKETLASWDELDAIPQLDSIKKARLSLYLHFGKL